MLITNYVSYYNTQYISSNGYVLSGINPSVSKITSYPTNGNVFHNSYVINPGLNNITIENIYFKGTGNKRHPTYHIVVDNDCSNIIIRGCVFDGATGGIIVRPGCKNVFIIGCTFRNMVYVPGAGAASGGNTSAGGAGSYGVVFHEEQNTNNPQVPYGVTHGVISGCVFESTVVRHAVYIQSSSDVLISDNVIYGTTAMNDQTLLDALLTTGLTEAQIDAFDVTKHMTVYDSAISFRGCSNVRIINNYLNGGICCLNGSKDVANPQHGGELYLFKDNIAKNFTKPSGGINRLFNLNNINTVIKENNTISNCTGYSQYW